MEEFPKTKRVCIVDAFSTGKYFSAALLEEGYQCVHVQSDPGIPAFFLESYPKNDFIANIVHEGDLEKTTKELESLDVGRVIVGFEGGVELADALQDRMGLPGNGTQTSGRRRDKFLMQKALRDKGVPTMAFYKTDDFEDLENWVKALGKWPVVLKPLKGAGTQGVHVCRDMDETGRAFKDIMEGANLFGKQNAAVLVEEFMSGREVAVNTISLSGRHLVSDVWEFRKEEIPGVAPVYNYGLLLEHPGTGLRGIVDYTFSALDALGVRLGPAHSEIKLTPDGPRLVETGARVMGANIPQDLISECIGWNQVELSILAYLHPERFLEKADVHYRLKKQLMLKFLISLTEYPIRSIPAMDIIRRLPSHRKTVFSVSPGGFMSRTIDLISSPAHVLLCHEDATTVMEDQQVLYNLEMEAADCLFEPIASGDLHPGPMLDPDLAESVPDEAWHSPLERAEADAATILECLGLRAGDRVLDSPCGDGRVAVHLARAGIRVTGIDINGRFIQKARERFEEAELAGEFYKMDMRFLPFKDEFDAVVVWHNSFGYFSGVDDIACMEGFGRALKPGGRLLVEAPNRRKVLGNIRENAPESKTAYPFRMYSEGEYRVLIRCAGLVFENVLGEGKTPFGPDSERMILIARKD